MKGATSIQERLWELRKDKGLNLEELSELTSIYKLLILGVASLNDMQYCAIIRISACCAF